MNNIEIEKVLFNREKYMPEIIKAFVQVLGEDSQNMVEKMMDKTIFIY